MRLWRVAAAALLAACVVGCGGNSAPLQIMVSSPGAPFGTTATVDLSGVVPYSAVVTGGPSNTNVFWQICLPPTISTAQPTNCTQGVGPVTGCNIPTISKPLVGYGIITAVGVYTAPSVVPQPSIFLAVATSCVSANSFSGQDTQIVSGITLQLSPGSVTIGTGEHYQLDLMVTNTKPTSVTWTVTTETTPPMVLPGGNSTFGFICPNVAAPQPCSNGEYVAPVAPPPGGAVTVTATSAVDPTQSAQTTITVMTAGNATIQSIDPVVTGKGSAQQDVYITGQNLFTTTQVIAGTNQDMVPVTFINTGLLRATIPAADLTGVTGPSVPINVVTQSGNAGVGGPINLVLTPLRPATIASLPDSFTQPNANVNVGVTLTGGYYSPGTTTATFNGLPVATTFTDSRHLSLGISLPATPDPGLYPIVVQNAGVAAPSAVNVAIKPIIVPTAPGLPIPVGTTPTAVAIDNALHLAIVANEGSGNVSVINLGTNTVSNTIAIPTINKGTSTPTSVAIDDVADNQLSHDLALVVDNGDNSVAVIDLVTKTVTQTIDLTPFTPTGSAPIAIGINPLTHRAIVANQSTNVATVIDLVTPNPSLAIPCTTPPCVLTTIGGDLPPFFSTGAKPSVAVDPRLNWAIVTPGGGGTVNVVDLGRNANAGDGGRQPFAVGSLTITTSIRGVGINTETHEVLLTDPAGTTLTTYSLLDNSVNATQFANGGVAFSEANFVAAGVNSLDNLGIVVNGPGGTVSVVDLESGNVLAADIPVGNMPQAVAVDQGTNRAVIVNQSDNSVVILTMGSSFRAPQIIETSPAVAFAQTATPLTLTINGAGFAAGAQVLVDGTPLPGGQIVKETPNQIVATIQPAMLGLAHRYILAVQNPGQMSNVTDLTVIQTVSTGVAGSAPFGVAVDNDRDIAVVTNTGVGSVALINLTTGTLETPTLSSSVLVGTSPQGVAVIPRMGLAVVANNGSDSYTVVDDTGNAPAKTGDCSTSSPPCQGPNGVAVDQDSLLAAITGSLSNSVNFVDVLLSPLNAGTAGSVDQNPGAIAIDPNPNPNFENAVFSAVATASQNSSVELVNTGGGTARRLSGFDAPTGAIFDPLNQVFIVADSLQDDLAFIDGTTFGPATVAVGVNPTSLDYNYQTSTLVTVNSQSNTMSVIEYVCSPVTIIGQPVRCTTAPQTRLVLGLPGSALPSQLQQYSVAIDLKMNLAVVVDQNNDRVLLIPLPH